MVTEEVRTKKQPANEQPQSGAPRGNNRKQSDSFSIERKRETPVLATAITQQSIDHTNAC